MPTSDHKSTFGPLATAASGFLLVLAILAQSACSDNDSTSGNPSPGATTVGVAVPTAAPGAGALEELAAKHAAGVDGHIVYAIDSQNWGLHPKGRWATYRQGNSIREDWTNEADGFEATNIAISSDDKFYFCSLTPFSETCTEQVSEEALDLVFVLFNSIKDIPLTLLSEELDYSSTELSTETIAGVDADCFDVRVNERIGDGPDGTESIKLCFDSDGRLLNFERRVVFTDLTLPEAWLTALAQEVSSPTQQDFQPPVALPAGQN